jgi:poly(3-hydroxybutyrate) depolymerase
MPSTGRLAAAALALLLPGVAAAQICPAAPPAGMTCGNPEFQSCGIDVNGITRHFCIHVPAAPATDLPVVFALHGGGGEASRAVAWVDSQTEQGAILVAPSAMPSRTGCSRHWRIIGSGIDDWADLGQPNDCAQAVGPFPASSSNLQDLDFITALLDHIDTPARGISGRYALGFSNGAGLAMQLYITEPLASRFDGYAFIGNGMNQARIAAAAGGSVGPYSANRETRRPVILIGGTSDKVFVFPAEDVGERLEAIDALPPNDPGIPEGCDTPLDTPRKTLECMMSTNILPGDGKHTLRTRMERTMEWLLAFNRPQPIPFEGLHPSRGYSGEAPLRAQDRTLAARRDYLRRGAPGSAAVSQIVVIDGRHAIPGARGAYAPCPGNNCDVNAIEEIFQFWRGQAGMRTLWR